MRDWWYGDKRDLVKWGTLFALASRHTIDCIVHVALYRPDRLDYVLDIGGEEVPLPAEVIRHFRDVDDIQRLATVVGRKVDVFKEVFQWTSTFRTRDEFRKDYFRRVADRLGTYHDQRLIVFLDPDTGIAPENYGYEHVTPQEIESLLTKMKSNDVLVFYQHARLGDAGWPEDTLSEFRTAIRETRASVIAVTCKDVANDVAFFVYTKP